jgi:hypothetical protein
MSAIILPLLMLALVVWAAVGGFAGYLACRSARIASVSAALEQAAAQPVVRPLPALLTPVLAPAHGARLRSHRRRAHLPVGVALGHRLGGVQELPRLGGRLG